MTLSQAIALLTDILANHKENRGVIQKELGNFRSDGFELQVTLNRQTKVLVEEVERQLRKLTAIKAMQSMRSVQVETQQTDDVPEVVEVILDAYEERTVEQVALLGLDVHSLLEEAPLETTTEAAFEQLEAEELDVRSLLSAAQNEVSDVALVEKVEAFKLDESCRVESAFSLDTKSVGETAENLRTEYSTELVEALEKPSLARTQKSLSEIMAQPDRPSTEEEEREFALLEELFDPWVQTKVDGKGETKLPDVQSPSTLLNSQSQTIQTAKSFESIVLALVVIVLVFKAVITVIKAI